MSAHTPKAAAKQKLPLVAFGPHSDICKVCFERKTGNCLRGKLGFTSMATIATHAVTPPKRLHGFEPPLPVVLEQYQFKPWLKGAAGLEVLKPAADDVREKCPLSTRVNSSRPSDGDAPLIEPIQLDAVPA